MLDAIDRLTTCPNCQAPWSIEEIEEQYCDTCTYPCGEVIPLTKQYQDPEPKQPEVPNV